MWGCSSAGRAPRSQRGGRGFEPPHLHHKQPGRTPSGVRLFFPAISPPHRPAAHRPCVSFRQEVREVRRLPSPRRSRRANQPTPAPGSRAQQIPMPPTPLEPQPSPGTALSIARRVQPRQGPGVCSFFHINLLWFISPLNISSYLGIFANENIIIYSICFRTVVYYPAKSMAGLMAWKSPPTPMRAGGRRLDSRRSERSD